MTETDELAALALWPDVGKRLGLGKSATYKAAAEGQIPTVRIGRRLVVPIPAFKRMLECSGKAA